MNTQHYHDPITAVKKQPQAPRRKYTKLSWQHSFVSLQAQLRVQKLEAILTISEKGPNKGVIMLEHLKRTNNAIKDYESFCRIQGVQDPLKGITYN